jgi:hypothetical protein
MFVYFMAITSYCMHISIRWWWHPLYRFSWIFIIFTSHKKICRCTLIKPPTINQSLLDGYHYHITMRFNYYRHIRKFCYNAIMAYNILLLHSITINEHNNQLYRRVWGYQRGNQNPYIEEEQTTQWLTRLPLMMINMLAKYCFKSNFLV